MLSNCPICGKPSIVSRNLSACQECIILNRNNILEEIHRIHAVTRKMYGLPENIPNSGRKECATCGNKCRILDGEIGYCGLRKNENGTIISATGSEKIGYIDWYYDILPTNCVADWVCEGLKHRGKKNLAVFYKSCSFNCLFCQNWHFREKKTGYHIHAEELAEYVDKNTFCICYFGGDPSTQIIHAITTSRAVLEKRKNIRICWETNGNISRKYLDEVINLSLKSGGIIKFDLKAFSENLHMALCGVSNKTTLENFEYIASLFNKRQNPPLLIASTLMIPEYVEEKEVCKIARFIANLNENIPYTLLAFHPSFFLDDIPTTSREQAMKCFLAAKEAGLKAVRIGNIHLLRD